jgi:hypothetical protein
LKKIHHGESNIYSNYYYFKYDWLFLRVDDDYSSNESDQSTSESENQSTTKRKDRKICVTFLESLSKYVPIEDKHPDAKPYLFLFDFHD